MGKVEWHFGGRSSSRRATTADHPQRRHRPSLPSCMSTLFHFFDFRSSRFTRIVFDNRHQSSFDLLHHRPPLPKASHHVVEASRNSLELEGASISCLRNKGKNLQLQMGLQIKTRNGSTKSKAGEQQLPNNDHIIALESPSGKTPNLLARLMGLDILPQNPSSSSSNCRGSNFGTRSLPESPRVSSARLSDVDCHHRRLSLQIISDKENINFFEEAKRENEKVRRKVALIDITNNNKKTELEKQEVGFSQSKVEIKSSKKLKKTVFDESRRSSKVVLKNQEVMISKKQKLISMSMQESKRRAREGEAFDCPTSNNLVNNLNHSTIFPAKKEPSPPAIQAPREQPCRYSKGKAKPAGRDGGERNAVDKTTTTDGGSAEFEYIKRILTKHGNSNSIISPSNNPTNPSIFHHPEAAEDQQWGRRLLNCWHVRRGMKGWELGEEAVRERSVKKEYFPRAKYEVVEDMDALIINKRVVEETEGIVKVVELHILDSLLRETVALISSLPKCSHFPNF